MAGFPKPPAFEAAEPGSRCGYDWLHHKCCRIAGHPEDGWHACQETENPPSWNLIWLGGDIEKGVSDVLGA